VTGEVVGAGLECGYTNPNLSPILSEMSLSPLQAESDKIFWHKYMPFYSKTLEGINSGDDFDILEVGVLNSKSILQWRLNYPNSRITGCDINYHPDWYSDARIYYLQFDQSNPDTLKKSIQDLSNPRIVVDDGSHIPFHQLTFLHIATGIVSSLSPAEKRVVIIEDLHTSLEEIINKSNHPTARIKHMLKNNMHDQSTYKRLSDIINPIGLLLGLEKIKSGSLTQDQMFDQIYQKVESPDLIKLAQEIIVNCLKADKITIFKRTTLPDKCWKCGSNLFDLATLRCQSCGEDGYKYADSITASLEYNIDNTLIL
jgi:hypothetical protein